jgi:NNP family nitrate/nitrite transporter-like MFS transporter
MTAPMEESTPTDRRTRETVGSPWLMLAMATLGFAVNFWAWALISPLGPLCR